MRLSVPCVASLQPQELTRTAGGFDHAGLAFLRLERQYSWIPWVGAFLYSLCTPIGMAIGLGLREGLVSLSSRFGLLRSQVGCGLLTITCLW